MVPSPGLETSLCCYRLCGELYGLGSSFFFFFFFLAEPHGGVLVSQPGIKPGPPAVEARSPNCWTAREFPWF